MLGSDRVYLALALVTTMAVGGATMAGGCGGGSTTGTGGHGGSTSSSSSVASSSGTGGTGGTGGAGGTGGTGGGDAGPTCPADMGTVFAGTKLDFGEGNSGQWKKIGFNLDGLVSTGNSTDVCLPNSGGMPGTAYPDGDNGIDNSFGKNLLPLIIGLYPTWTSDINNELLAGIFTVLLKLECLPAMGDAPMLTTKLFGGTLLGTTPKFDGTDKWPVEPELLSNPMDPESSTIIFGNCSVIGTTFDSGNNNTFILSVPVNSQGKSTSIKLTLYAAHLTMTLSADRKSATGGRIGGVLNTEEFVTQVNKVGSLLGLCNTSLFNQLITQIRQASDIMADGTQDPTQTCNGISMGLGFEMKEVLLGDVGPATAVGAACQ